jgi:Muconolactone delta-isomerase.
MLFQVRMDVNIPKDMPLNRPMKLRQLKKPIHRICNARVSGVISGASPGSIQTSVFLMLKAMKSCTTCYKACRSTRI